MSGLRAPGYVMAGWHTWEFWPFLNRNGGRMGGNTGGGGRTGMRGERENCDWTVKQTNKYIKRIALEIIVYYWKERKF